MQLILKSPSLPSTSLNLSQDLHYKLSNNVLLLYSQRIKEAIALHFLDKFIPGSTKFNANVRNGAVPPSDSPTPLPIFHDYNWGLLLEGKFINDHNQLIEVPNSLPFLQATILPRLRGGKGGFGTLLRGKGARGPKTSNYESSRDLQGRRLRTARAPERMRQWVDKKIQEHEIIKAVGGEDPFIGKQLSAEEVVKLYKLKIPSDSHNPFEELPDPDEDVQAQIRQQAVQLAAQAITKNVQHDILNGSARSAESSFLLTHQQELDAYLDIGL